MSLNSIFITFFGMALCDVLWAVYFLMVSKKNKTLAAISSGLIVLMSAFVIVDYVRDTRLVFVATLGAMFGTYMVLYFNEWKEHRETT